MGIGGGGRSGRIILLGDGTEVLTDNTDGDFFDSDDEEKDLASQVNKSGSDEGARGEREGTPGPGAAASDHAGQEPSTTTIKGVQDSK